MAWFFPTDYRRPTDRRQQIVLREHITDTDIRSFTEADYGYLRLMSGDIIYYSLIAQEAKRKENRNDIVSAIVGSDIYGPVFLLEAKDMI